MITNFHFKTIKYRKSFLWPDLSDSFKDSFHYKYSRVRNKRPRTLITVILEKILTKKCLFQPPILFRMEIFSTHPFSCGWKIKKVLYYYSYTNFFVCVFINLPDEYSIVHSWEINTPVSNQKNYRFSLLKFSKFSLLFLHENTVVIPIFSYFIVAFRHPLFCYVETRVFEMQRSNYRCVFWTLKCSNIGIINKTKHYGIRLSVILLSFWKMSFKRGANDYKNDEKLELGKTVEKYKRQYDKEVEKNRGKTKCVYKWKKTFCNKT